MIKNWPNELSVDLFGGLPIKSKIERKQHLLSDQFDFNVYSLNSLFLALDQLWILLSFCFGSYRKNIINLNHQQKKLDTFCFLTCSVGFKVKPQITKTPWTARLEVVLSWVKSEFRI